MNWYQKVKKHVEEMPKWEKCAFPTCDNEVTAIGKRYCGKSNCPKIQEDKLIARFGKENLAFIRQNIDTISENLDEINKKLNDK